MVYDGKTDLYMDDLRVPPFQEISIYVHVYIYMTYRCIYSQYVPTQYIHLHVFFVIQWVYQC